MPTSGSDRAGDAIAESASKSYVYGYPLVLMDLTEETSLATTDPPYTINEFTSIRKFPTWEYTTVVRPNVDTLYSIAWLDLADGPLVLTVPATNHYYLLPILDVWTNVVDSPGPRTTGTGSGKYLIARDTWPHECPDGVTELKRSPTDMCWIIGRIECDDEQQYDEVWAVQNDILLEPLNAPAGHNPRRASSEGRDHLTPPEQVAAMSADKFFTRLADLMIKNPPSDEDRPMVTTMQNIGLQPGSYDPVGVPQSSVQKGVDQARRILEAAGASGDSDAGWSIPPANLGTYGCDYLTRAVVALEGLGANTPADAVYPSTQTDGQPQPQQLNGAHRYTLSFDVNNLPPANADAFWSVTLYNEDGHLVENPLDRYKLGVPGMNVPGSGQLSMYIQAEDPGDEKTANWLPSPEGDFNLYARLYWPNASAQDGSWVMPAVMKVDE